MTGQRKPPDSASGIGVSVGHAEAKVKSRLILGSVSNGKRRPLRLLLDDFRNK